MSLILDRRSFLVAGTALTLVSPAHGAGTTHDIQMLNRHPENRRITMVFHPIIQVVQPGDTVRFVPTNPGHNSQTIDGMLPVGAQSWRSRLNQEVSVTLTIPGFYGYKCLPHTAMGMVGLIIVEGDGMMDNLAAARAVRHRGRAGKAWDEIWAQAASDGLLG